MQKLTEDNMENIFWLEFIKTEFQLNNLRIDSLAYDNESNSFVIIEYKRWNSYSVIDQWMSYLALMLNNKADFVQELWKKRKKFVDSKDIDWSQSRIIIIADSFNRYQKESINFKDLAIDLWELKQFNDWTIVFNPIKASNTTESIKTVTKYDTWELKNVNKEIKTYTVDDLIKPNWNKTKELFEEFSEYILLLDSNLKEQINSDYISYKNWFKVLVALDPYKLGLSIYFPRLKKIDLIDEKDFLIENWNNRMYISTKEVDEDKNYVKNLIKQAYNIYNK
jgi:predicted transport protein